MLVLATALSAALAFAIGALWYSPVLFGRAWQAAVGRDSEELSAERSTLATSAAVWLVAAIGFAFMAHAMLGNPNAGALLSLAFIGWIAFCVPHLVMASLFQGSSPALIWIDGGYHLVAMLAMAAVHAFLV